MRHLFLLKAEQADWLTSGPVNVRGYTRKDGVAVKPHTATRKKHQGDAGAKRDRGVAALVKQTVAATMAARSTAQLCADFEATNDMNDENIPVVRGWIMDALEARDPEAFDRWINADPADMDLPSRFFL